MIDDDVEFSYVLTDFIPSGSVHFWERDAEVPKYDSEFISF